MGTPVGGKEGRGECGGRGGEAVGFVVASCSLCSFYPFSFFDIYHCVFLSFCFPFFLLLCVFESVSVPTICVSYVKRTVSRRHMVRVCVCVCVFVRS